MAFSTCATFLPHQYWIAIAILCHCICSIVMILFQVQELWNCHMFILLIVNWDIFDYHKAERGISL